MSDFFKSLEQPFNLLDEQAFEANRRGEITVAQQKQLTSAVGWGRIVLLGLVMLAIVGILGSALFPVILSDNWRRDMVWVLFVAGIFAAFLFFIGYGVWSQVSKAVKLRHDFANRAIRQGQGQLVHSKKGYVFEMNGISLHLAANLSNGLLPGSTYQVYYLEESGALLSATMSSQANPAVVQATLNEILASANGFSTDDLLANQNGEITFWQRRKLLPNIIFGIGMLLGSLFFAIPFFLSPFLSNDNSVFGLLFVLVIIGIFWVMGGVLLIKGLLDMFSARPQQMQGLIYKERRVVRTGRSSHVEYYYTIMGQRFSVDYRAYTALIDGLQYRIHYLPRTKKLIAIEALPIARF